MAILKCTIRLLLRTYRVIFLLACLIHDERQAPIAIHDRIIEYLIV